MVSVEFLRGVVSTPRLAFEQILRVLLPLSRSVIGDHQPADVVAIPGCGLCR